MVTVCSSSSSWLYSGIVGVLRGSSLFSRKANPSMAASVSAGASLLSSSASMSSVFMCVGMWSLSCLLATMIRGSTGMVPYVSSPCFRSHGSLGRQWPPTPAPGVCMFL